MTGTRTTKGTTRQEHWLTVKDAATLLSISPEVLRQMIGRHAKHAGGLREAHFDGVLARKLGTRWRVRLGPWAEASQHNEVSI